MMRRRHFISAVLCAGLWISSALAEEIWLHDNTRVYGLVKGITADAKLNVLLPSGKTVPIPLADVIAISFLGRDPLLMQSGTQEFRFIGGGRLRGQILGAQGDSVRVQTAAVGLVDLGLNHLRGFISLPMVGFSSLKAEELVEGESKNDRQYQDMLIDRRGSVYWGVLRQFERTALHLDIDDLLQVRAFKILYLKGVRMADAARDPERPWDGHLQVSLTCRDGSVFHGELVDIRFNRWRLRSSWDPKLVVPVALDEIALVRTLGGAVQYLSQLTPVEVKESTILAPPQPYQMNHSCQKDSLSIAGKRYPWGIGVHADSELTFSINRRFKEFRSAVGLATSVGDAGSVIFEVLGDGKSLYRSGVIRGSDNDATQIAVPVSGVNKLTLKVTEAGDLDLGDVANWGSARLLKYSATPAPVVKPAPGKPTP